VKNFKWNKRYLYAGVTAFLVIAACIAFYWIIQRWSGMRDSFSTFFSILSPIIGGFVLAYLLTPFVKFYELKLFMPLGRKMYKDKEKKAQSFGRGMGIFLALIVLIGLIAAIFSLIIPQVYNSVVSIVFGMSSTVQKVEDWANKWLAAFPGLETSFKDTVNKLGGNLSTWAQNTLLPQMNNIVTNVSLGIYNVVKALTNFIISVVFSVYVMFSREKFAAGGKKTLYSIFNVERVKKMLAALRYTNKIFLDFFTGKLVESLIVGVLCYIGCLILGMPNVVLISVIVGVTDIIPFFGPFIGAIPSALIVLIYSPVKCLVFVIFIIILHQFDGNIMGPKILGDATGLSGFWVLFAIIVGGGLFGFIGMIAGVPAFAVIYTGVKSLVNAKLKKSGLPSETAKYVDMSYIDPESLAPVAFEQKIPGEGESEARKIADRVSVIAVKIAALLKALWQKIMLLRKTATDKKNGTGPKDK